MLFTSANSKQLVLKTLHSLFKPLGVFQELMEQ